MLPLFNIASVPRGTFVTCLILLLWISCYLLEIAPSPWGAVVAPSLLHVLPHDAKIFSRLNIGIVAITIRYMYKRFSQDICMKGYEKIRVI